MKKLFLFMMLAAVVVAIYTQRSKIQDWWFELQKPNVAPIAYDDVREQEAADTDQGTDIGEEETGESGVSDEIEVGEEVETPEEAVGDSLDQPEEALDDEGDVTGEDEPTSDIQQPSDEIPKEFNLAVPFTSQAPHGNWELPYQETCEEASVLMVAYYYDNKPAGAIDAGDADVELLKIVEFEEAFFGYYKDTTAEETALLIESYYHLGAELLVDPTVDDIKLAVSSGNPVIVPSAGRDLYNPYFTPPGPVYHMLVVKGYTEDGFIVNDPGTRRGEDYFYAFDVLLNAVHDWNGGDVANGQKVVIVVKP